jgi:hypothetical protein
VTKTFATKRHKKHKTKLPISVCAFCAFSWLLLSYPRKFAFIRGLLINSLCAAAAADRPARPARHEFGLGKHPQKVFPQDLANVLFAIAAFQ